MVWIVLGFAGVLFICLYLIFNLLRKVETLSDLFEASQVKREEALEFIEGINNRFFEDYTNLKKIDARGSFESDDEVGFVFDTIKETVEKTFVFLNENIENLDKNAEKEKTK